MLVEDAHKACPERSRREAHQLQLMRYSPSGAPHASTTATVLLLAPYNRIAGRQLPHAYGAESVIPMMGKRRAVLRSKPPFPAGR